MSLVHKGRRGPESAMKRCAALVIAGWLGVLAAAAPVWAQVEEPAAPAESEIERYLGDHGLSELLAVYLLGKLKDAEGDAKLKLADRLGSLYVRLLDKASTVEERLAWETKSQELLSAVPEADSFELRLNLAKARYLQAEDIAERHRLRLATPEEQQEAERVLRTAGGVFNDIGNKLTRRVELLEKREIAGKDEDGPQIRRELGDARRLRSLAMYYSGWSSYYTAFLSGKPALAEEAISQFGWLLNASGGRQASVTRVPTNLLRYEHVARAAIGCALAESMRGRDGAAMLWLDALESTEGVPAPVTKQIVSRRIWVYAAARRWGDLEYLIKRTREPGREQPIKPLGVGEARLVAVVALEALQDKSLLAASRPIVQGLADTAMTDLITLGEVGHVQDLVSKYGTTPLGGEGFIVQYVRGLQVYDRAREAHAATGKSTDEPTSDDAVINLYRESARSLKIAVAAEDGSRFPDERSNAGLLLGLSLLYAGDLQEAADRFEMEFQAGAVAKRSEDALWLAIVSLDKAVEGGKLSQRERLGRLSALYLQKFPKSERSARLLLRQTAAELLTPERAVEILLGVEKESPLYEAARRQAASVLYGMYRGGRGKDRDFAALRFAEISEELLKIDSARLSDAATADREQVTAQILVRVRQVLDVVLGMAAPDLDRAEKAFQLLDLVTITAGLDLKQVEDELTYRRLQIALARGRTDDITRSLDKLRGLGGRFADAADRLMYKRALSSFDTPNPPPGAAMEVVRHGLRVIDQFERDPNALADPAVYALHSAVAGAAARVWLAERDESMRDLALGLDKALMNLGNPPAPVLKRFAELSESAGRIEPALDAWRMLLAGVPTTSPEWLEARYHSIRLLFLVDPARAREAMDQFKVLNPEFGPEPWGPRIRDLDGRIPANPVAEPARAPAVLPGGGTGR